MRIRLCTIVAILALAFSAALATDSQVQPAAAEEAVVSEVKMAKRGRAAVMASPGRVKAAADEREYAFDVWDAENVASVSGFVTTKGLPEMNGGDIGDVRWRIAGSKISGYLVKNGSNVAAFSGTISRDGAIGTVKTSRGDSGTWVWDGPLPEVEQVDDAEGDS